MNLSEIGSSQSARSALCEEIKDDKCNCINLAVSVMDQQCTYPMRFLFAHGSSVWSIQLIEMDGKKMICSMPSANHSKK